MPQGGGVDLYTLVSVLTFLFIAFGMRCVISPPVLPGNSRKQLGLEQWLLPLAPGIGLWLVLQFSAFSWLGWAVSPWLPMCLACIGWIRLALSVRSGQLVLPGPDSQTANLSSELAGKSFWDRRGLLAIVLLIHLLLLMAGSWMGPLPGLDPWQHCLAALYIRETGSIYEPFADLQIIHYADAYPPGLPILTANAAMAGAPIPSVLMWINGLSATLGIAWFHALATKVLGSNTRALAATAVLAAMPSFLTRHPWGHTQSIALIIASLYFLMELLPHQKAEHENEPDRDHTDATTESPRSASRTGGQANGSIAKAWISPAISAALCLSGTMLTAPSQGLKAAMLALVLFVAVLVSRYRPAAVVKVASVGVLACVLIIMAWLGPMYARYHSLSGIRRACNPPVIVHGVQALDGTGGGQIIKAQATSSVPPIYDQPGSSDRDYGWMDFFGFGIGDPNPEAYAPAGCGGSAFLLAIIGILAVIMRKDLIASEQNVRFRTMVAIWLLASFAFAFVGVHGNRLPLRLFPWRFWFLLSIFVALLAVPGWLTLMRWMPKGSLRRVVAALLLAGFAVSLGWKAYLNIKHFRPKRLLHPKETDGYHELGKTLATDSWVYPLAGPLRFEHIAGIGCRVRCWDREDYEFAERSIALTPEETAQWFESRSYSHLTLDLLYGLGAIRRQVKAGAISLTQSESQKVITRTQEIGLDPPSSISEMLRDYRYLLVLTEIMIARKADQLAQSGRFEVIFDNGVLVCLEVK